MDIRKLRQILNCSMDRLVLFLGMQFPKADLDHLTYEECFYVTMSLLKQGDLDGNT